MPYKKLLAALTLIIIFVIVSFVFAVELYRSNNKIMSYVLFFVSFSLSPLTIEIFRKLLKKG